MTEKISIQFKGDETHTLDLEHKPAILISRYLTAYKKLIGICNNLGYDTYVTDKIWPRDQFIGQNGFYMGFNFSKAAQGGNVVYRNRSMLISDKIPNREVELAKMRDFFDEPIYATPCLFAPTKSDGSRRRESYIDHIDLTMLSIPQKNLMLVDSNHYAQQHNALERILSRNEIIEVKNGPEWYDWPLNCLVLEDNGNPVVVVNYLTDNIQGVLKDLGIDYETVASEDCETLEGSIRCRTNEAENAKVFRMADLEIYRP